MPTARKKAVVSEAPRRTRVVAQENRYLPYEAKLNASKVNFIYAARVALTDITRYASAQARLRLAGSSTVNEYAEKMRAGEVFPPLVLSEHEGGGYTLLDGNTRKAAYEKRGQTHADAYVITDVTDENQQVYISGLFNTINGVPFAKDEFVRMVKAGKAMDPPMSDARLAKDLGLPPARVSRIVAIERFNKRADALGLTKDITDDTKMLLAPIPDNAVVKSVLDLALDADLKGKDLRPLLKKVNGKKSEKERLKVVKDERADYATTIKDVAAGRTSTAPPSKDSRMALGRIHSLMGKFPNVDDWVPVRPEARDEWLPKIKAVAVFLDTLAIAYEAAGVTA